MLKDEDSPSFASFPLEAASTLIFDNTLSTYLRFARRLLVQVLEEEKNAVVKIPSEEEIILYKAAVGLRHPMLSDVWIALDG